MEKRMLLAIVLSFVAVTAYSAITGRGCMAPPPKKTEPPPANGTEDGAQPQPQPVAPPGDGQAPAPAPIPAPAPGDGQPAASPGPAPAPAPAPKVDFDSHPQRAAPIVRAVLESPELKVGFTSQGGAVEFVQQQGAYESDNETPFDQILPPDPIMLFCATDDVGLTPPAAPGGADRRNMAPGPMRLPQLQWTRDTATEAATPENDVVFTFETAEGLLYRKQYWLLEEKKRYTVMLRLSVEAKGPYDRQTVDLKILAASGQLRERVQGAFAQPSGVIARMSNAKDVSATMPWGMPIEELKPKGLDRPTLRVFGSRSTYFMTLFYAAGGSADPTVVRYWATGEDAKEGRGPIEESVAAFYRDQRGKELATDEALKARVVAGVQEMHHCWMVVRLPVSKPAQGDQPKVEAKPVDMSFYVGPVERSTLRSDGYEPLRSVITYPNAFDFVADILLAIYDLWLGLLNSAGIAIILMTLCVRGAMMPISIRNQLSMRRYGRKVAKLKPKVQALQQRFANNPKKLREEQMKLYREHGVGFPTGCLMMLIQIPIFFALFSSLRVEYTIRGAEFLWITDLSGPDKLIDFGSRIFDVGILYVESLNILPLLMVTLSIIHMRNMPKPADEQQAQQMRMMKWLPIVFAVILYNYTAALALYMVLSSAFAIIESKIVRLRDDDEVAQVPAKA